MHTLSSDAFSVVVQLLRTVHLALQTNADVVALGGKKVLCPVVLLIVVT